MPLRLFAVLVLIPGLIAPAAGQQGAIADILARPEPPAGVVFEIIEPDPEALRHLIPQISQHLEDLRERFPGLPVAVVSHGPELFALQRERAEELSALHGEVRRLTGEAGVDVHACGTFAGWRDVAAEAFPDYVDVAPSGPAEIRRYEEHGYIRVRL